MNTMNWTIGALALTWCGAISLQAQSAKDELNYSGAICTPRSAEQFQGNGRLGFIWDARGFWMNLEDDAFQTLACAVPFDFRAKRADNSFGVVEVRVDILDASPNHEVTAKLFGSSGANPLALRNPLTTGFTSNAFTGATTILLQATPPEDTRYLWLEIEVPRTVFGAGSSAVIGFRLNRVGFN